MNTRKKLYEMKAASIITTSIEGRLVYKKWCQHHIPNLPEGVQRILYFLMHMSGTTVTSLRTVKYTKMFAICIGHAFSQRKTTQKGHYL